MTSRECEQVMIQIVKFEMAGGWTTEETKVLFGIWGDSTVQSQLDGVVRNKTIYLKIARGHGVQSHVEAVSDSSRTWGSITRGSSVVPRLRTL